MKKKDFITDYALYILLKSLGPLIRLLPLSASFFIGRTLGDLAYLVDLKHRAVAYANIKKAFPGKFSPGQIRGLVRKFYRCFGQNIIEIFYIPKFDGKYLKENVIIEGLSHAKEGFARGKGVVFVAVHAGSWELGNIVSSNLGFPFSTFVREQNLPRVGKLLDSYRSSKGCRFIQRESELKELVRVLKANESVAMTIDQGGKDGIRVNFFGMRTSFATGAVRLALKLGCALIPVFPVRVSGARIKFFVERPFQLKSTGNLEEDVKTNLQELAVIFENYIARYPQEYLWTYKIWKYSGEKRILILSDGKTGHLRQSQSLAKITGEYLGSQGIGAYIDTEEVKFKSAFAAKMLGAANCLSGKYICQGCMLCLRAFLDPQCYSRLMRTRPDIIVSCGSSLVPVNYQLSRENLAKSFVIMRPSVFSARRFDLVVMPRHDRPPRMKNIAIVDGALNLVDEAYLKDQAGQLTADAGIKPAGQRQRLGLLIGGDTRNFRLEARTLENVLGQVKEASVKSKVGILATTSRRTSREAETAVKGALSGWPQTELLVVANEKNFTSAVGGILGLSHVVVVSCESISMISEAVSSLKHVVVFLSGNLPERHHYFLRNLRDSGRIRLVKVSDVGAAIEAAFNDPVPSAPLKDNLVITEHLRRIL